MAGTRKCADPSSSTGTTPHWTRGQSAAFQAELLNEGKREGYISSELPQELIVSYLELIRRGVFASPELLETIKPELEVYRQLNYLFIYGLVGKRD